MNSLSPVKVRISACAVAAILLNSGCAVRPGGSSAEQEVIAAQQAQIRANNAADVAAVDSLTADEFIGVNASGVSRTKAQLRDELVKRGPANVQATPEQLSERQRGWQVRVYGNIAVLTRLTAGDHGARSWITTVWVLRERRWQRVLSQVTTAAPPSLQPTPAPSTRLEDAPDQYYSVGDIRIRYREIGRGQPVILLHGRANALEIWTWLADSLAADHRVIALDERGHGKSSKSADPARYGPAMADDVLGLLDHLGIRRAAIVGHSQGALLAAFVAMHVPERVTRIALLAGPFFPDSTTYAAENAVLVRDLQTGHGFEGFLKAHGVSDSAARARSAATMEHNDAASLAAVMMAQGGLMPDRRLAGRITVPALIIVGANDELLDYNRTLASWWPDANFVIVPNATHMAILRRTETLVALRAHLRD